MFALVYVLIDANRYGSGSTRIVDPFVISAVCLGAFVALELRERVPMLDVCCRGSPLTSAWLRLPNGSSFRVRR